MKDILIVGIGGGLGSICRYGINLLCQRLVPVAFPLGTFTVNILGSLLIGVFLGLFYRQIDVPKAWQLLAVTGFCGGFTTFSAFSAENLQLIQEGSFSLVGTYIIGSVILGVMAVALGFFLAR